MPKHVYLDAEAPGTMDQAAASLNSGGVIVFPTDTVYGLLAAQHIEAAYSRIYRIKDRNPASPLAILVHHDSAAANQARQALADWPQLTGLFQSGQLTVILEPAAVNGLAPVIQKIQPGPAGLRQPADQMTRRLLELNGGCLWATSANQTGQPVCTSTEELDIWIHSVSDMPDLIVAATQPLSGTPSSVVRLCDGQLSWIRQ